MRDVGIVDRADRSIRKRWERAREITGEVRTSLRHRPGVDRAVRRDDVWSGSDDTGTDVHRRIAARRAEVEAEAAFSRRSRTVSLLLGIVLAGGIVAVILFTPILSVRDIEVTGLEPGSAVDADAVLHSAGLHEGDNLLLVSSSVAAGGVETLPGVESASVHKTFPGKVSIDVVPRVVVAATRAASGFAILDASGQVVEIRPDLTGSALALVRPSDPPADGAHGPSLAVGDVWADGLGRQSVAALEALPAGALPPPVEVGFEHGALTMTFANTPRIVFGTADSIGDKAVVAARVLADLRARGAAVDYVDVSSPLVPTILPRS